MVCISVSVVVPASDVEKKEAVCVFPNCCMSTETNHDSNLDDQQYDTGIELYRSSMYSTTELADCSLSLLN